MVGAAPTVAPPPPNVPPPIVIKEENLPSEEELLKMVSLEEKQVEEVRGGDFFTLCLYLSLLLIGLPPPTPRFLS